MNTYLSKLIGSTIKDLIWNDLKQYLPIEILEKSTIEYNRSHEFNGPSECYQLVTKIEDDTLRLMIWNNDWFALYENSIRVECIDNIALACDWYVKLYNQDPNLSIKRGIEE